MGSSTSSSCTTVLALLLSAFFVACEASNSGTTAIDGTSGVPEWQTEYEEMVAVLSLSDDDADILFWAFENRDEAIVVFMASPEGQQLQKEEKLLWDAVKGRNLARVRGLTATASGNRDRLRAVIGEAEATIRDAIPSEKRVPWDAHLISSNLLELAEPLSLDYEQEFRIQEHAIVCVEAARAADQPSPLPAAYVALEQWVEAAVLTPQQKTAFEDIKQANPFRTFVD